MSMGTFPLPILRRCGRALLMAAACVVAGVPMAASAVPPEPPVSAQPPGLQVMYSCPGGTDFAAAFSNDGDLATLTVPGQPDVELSRQPSGSGFAYGDSYYELRGRGREANLTAAGRSMSCRTTSRSPLSSATRNSA